MRLIVILSLSFLSCFQPIVAQSKRVLKEKNAEIYRISRMFNDSYVSKFACYELINIEGSLSNYKDSLAKLYLEEKNYKASLSLSNELLQTKASNFALKINAHSLKGLNNYQEANVQFKKLIKEEKQMSTCFELAYTEWKLGDYQSALSTIDYAFALHVKDVKSVIFTDNGNNVSLSLNDALNIIRIKIYEQNKDTVNLKKILLMIENEAASKILLVDSESSNTN